MVAHVGEACARELPAARAAAASSAALVTHQPYPRASTLLARMLLAREVDADRVVAEAVAHRVVQRHRLLALRGAARVAVREGAHGGMVAVHVGGGPRQSCGSGEDMALR